MYLAQKNDNIKIVDLLVGGKMKISIAGKNIEIGNAFKQYIEERVASSSEKLLSHINWVDVTISKQGYLFHTNIIMHEDNHITIKSSASSDEVYHSFDITLLKIEKQLRKYKDKIKSKRKSNKQDSIAEITAGTKYVLSNNEQTSETNDEPITIAEKATNIEHFSVSEAIMKMELLQLPALLFYNASNGRLNVVYKREDGNISWVDPKEKTNK